MKRLYEVVRERDQLEKHLQAAVARAMNQSQQTVKNWEKRGISKEGALLAQTIWGCDANELRAQPVAVYSKSRQNNVTEVREASPDFPPLWPFDDVTRPQWLALDSDERADVERFALRLIKSKQPAPAKNKSAAA
ncbi:hypothetical protein P3G55_21945 [Leptospira sp. 96542]|nr:hypothetical protein [Leptospira sp. 96542]